MNQFNKICAQPFYGELIFSVSKTFASTKKNESIRSYSKLIFHDIRFIMVIQQFVFIGLEYVRPFNFF